MNFQYGVLRIVPVLLLFLIPRPGAAQHQEPLWEPTDGPPGGDMHLLVVDKTQDILLASRGKALFEYRGAAWTSTDAPGENITAFHITPAGTYFIATSRPHPDIRFAKLSAVFRSEDGGENWVPAGLTEVEGEFEFITLSPDGTLFAGGTPGLFRSEDDGESWTTVTPTGAGGGLVTSYLTFAPDGALFSVAEDFSVYRSENSGNTWTVQQVAQHELYVNSLTIDEGGVLYAGVTLISPTSISYVIAHSTDNGQTWLSIGDDLPNFPISTLLIHGDVLFAGMFGGGFFRSVDQGETWEKLDLPARYARTITTGAEHQLFAGTTQGVFESNDGGISWTFLGAGMHAHTITSLLTRADGSLLAGTDTGGLFSLRDGEAWSRLDLPSINVRTLLETDTALLVGTQRTNEFAPEGAFYSTDGGTTWEQAIFTTAPHPIFPNPISFTTTTILDLLARPDGTLYAAANDKSFALVIGVYRSQDGGRTWTQTLLRRDNDNHLGATALALTPNGTVLAATRDGLYALNEDGDTWSQRADQTANTLLALPNGDVLLGALDGLYHLLSGSTTATRVALDDLAIYDLLANTEGDLFAATEAGVYRSNNGGVTWREVSLGLRDTAVLSLTLATDGTLYAGTDGDGVYRTTPAFTRTDTETATGFPERVRLSSAYPNPFNHQTTVRYELAAAGPVRLVVYDVLGREVATLVNSVQPAGLHTAIFDASTLPAGLYLLRAEAGGVVAIRSALYVR